jgi:hypothetical protein
VDFMHVIHPGHKYHSADHRNVMQNSTKLFQESKVNLASETLSFYISLMSHYDNLWKTKIRLLMVNLNIIAIELDL